MNVHRGSLLISEIRHFNYLSGFLYFWLLLFTLTLLEHKNISSLSLERKIGKNKYIGIDDILKNNCQNFGNKGNISINVNPHNKNLNSNIIQQFLK